MPHGALHHLLPSVLMVFKHIKSIFDDMQHIMRIIIGKGKAIARILILIVRHYSVLKTTGLPDYRQRTLSHRHELAQAARLKKRRHEKCVTACIYLMCIFL